MVGSSLVRLAFLAAIAILASSSTTQAAPYNQFVGFGDSTLDSGWWRGAFAGQCAGLGSPCTTLDPNRDPRIANALANGGNGSPVGVGQMHSEVLAGMLGLTAAPINQPGGTNYAISGSLTAELVGGAGNLSPNLILPATTQQISNYLSANPTANSDALYMIGTGSNDISWAATNLAAGARQGFLNGQIAQLVSSVVALRAAGAEHFIVNGVQNTSPLGIFYNDRLQQELTLAGIDFTYVDVAAFIAQVTANPAAYGYAAATVVRGVPGPTTGSACVAGPGAQGWGQFCANTTTPSPPGTPYARLRSPDAQETSFFADDGHLSASGQRWLAEYEYSLLAPAVPEASTWAMMLLGFAGVGFLGYRRSRRWHLAGSAAVVKWAFCALVLTSVLPTQANALIVDRSPEALGADWAATYANWANHQNFAVAFTLTAPTTVTMIGIYTHMQRDVGASTVVRLWEDDGTGRPDTSSLVEFNSTIATRSTEGQGVTPLFRIESHFNSGLLAAGTYWIGLTGAPSPFTDTDIGWAALRTGPGQRTDQWQLFDTALMHNPNINALSYVIGDGSMAAVPEPSTWAMIIAGFAGISFVGLRQARRRTPGLNSMLAKAS